VVLAPDLAAAQRRKSHSESMRKLCEYEVSCVGVCICDRLHFRSGRMHFKAQPTHVFVAWKTIANNPVFVFVSIEWSRLGVDTCMCLYVYMYTSIYTCIRTSVCTATIRIGIFVLSSIATAEV
jgi:hypothetical protein